MIVAKYTAMVKIPASLNPFNPTIKKVSFVLARILKNCPAKRNNEKFIILPFSLLVTVLMGTIFNRHSPDLINVMPNMIIGNK